MFKIEEPTRLSNAATMAARYLRTDEWEITGYQAREIAHRYWTAKNYPGKPGQPRWGSSPALNGKFKNRTVYPGEEEQFLGLITAGYFMGWDKPREES